MRIATKELSGCGMAGSLGLAWVTAHPDWFAFYEADIFVTFDRDALPAGNATTAVSTNPSDLIEPYICLARVRPEDDPLNIFAPYVTIYDSTVRVRVPLTTVPAAYFAKPYPCRVLIHTSDVTRTITLAPIVKAME